jgi:hypothetical protein
MPRWLLARPYLLAGALSWRNRQRRHRALLPAILALALICAGLLTLPAVGAALQVLAQYPVTPFIVLAAACAVMTARRKTRVYRSLADSWLAPLAAPASIAVRMVYAPLLQLSLSWMAIAIASVAGSLSREGAGTLALVVGSAYVAGFVVGWLTPHGKTVSAPDFHYVAVRKPRTNWALAPNLAPLSYWAVGQAHVSTKPKVTGRALFFVLLSLPMGMGGEKAIVIVAGSWVVLYLLSLCLSAVRVAFPAARWLAPTTLRYLPFAGAVGYRVILAQLWVCAWVLFLASAADLPGTLGRALSITGRCLLISCVAIPLACWMAMRAAGMLGGERGVGR